MRNDPGLNASLDTCMIGAMKQVFGGFCFCFCLVLALFAVSCQREQRAVLPVVPATEPDIDLVSTVEMVPVQYRHKLVQQLSLAEDNQQTWLKAIVTSPADHREALAFLLDNMPESDLKTLNGAYLLQNIELAYQARQSSAWARAIPQEIFFADVLPYVNVDETRENWRADYFNRFMPLVKNAPTAAAAEQILNREIFSIVKVKYHATKRLKPNQSPSESEKIGYASCTGLSIILSDACRAVGVPARLAGTPLWSDKSGNHTWTEIWDHQWYFVGSAEPGKLNHTWFVENAAKADDNVPENRIYAAAFERTATVFPLVWNETQTDVHAVDVTGYYTNRQTLTIQIPANESVEIRQNGVLQAQGADSVDTFSLAGGTGYAIDLVDGNGKKISSRTVSLPKDSALTVDMTR